MFEYCVWEIIIKMNVQSIKTGVKAVAGLAFIGTVIGVTHNGEVNRENNINRLNQEIQMKDSVRYSNIQKANKTKDVYFLEAQAKRMNDSLIADSALKKAYFEGAQMVRDSIKKASKVIK